MEAAEDSDGRPGRRSKVERLIEEYGLTGVGRELERDWTAEGERRRSLRELADDFNQELLWAVASDAGVTLESGDLSTTYRALVDEDASQSARNRVTRRLEREEIDVDELTDSFVSYQAIRTYLQNCRGAEYEPDDRDSRSKDAENVRRLVGRTEAVAQSKLDGHREAGRITLGSFEVTASVHAFCVECETRLPVERILEQGGCDCIE